MAPPFDGCPTRGGGFAPTRRGESAPHCRCRKVRLTPFPPCGENCARFLAPSLPTGTASLAFLRGPRLVLPKRERAVHGPREKTLSRRESVLDSRKISARGVGCAWVWRFGTPPSSLSAAAPWERRGSVSGAWRTGFPSTTSDNRRSVNAGRSDSKDENSARR